MPTMPSKRLAIFLALVFWCLPAAAQNAPLSDFAGTYQGSGVAEGRDNVYFTVTARDLDVTIKPTGAGFDVSWTTSSHGAARGQRVSRKSETVSFLASERPDVFRAAAKVEPLDGEPYYWARVAGRTLTIYAMTIAGNGAYELTSWSRTLTRTGMDLTFRRLSDGEAVRTVRGKLVRTSP